MSADKLADALRIAMEWNWLDDDARPSRVAKICDDALAEHAASLAAPPAQGELPEFPPLPSNPAVVDPGRFGVAYSADQMRAYARETIVYDSAFKNGWNAGYNAAIDEAPQPAPAPVQVADDSWREAERLALLNLRMLLDGFEVSVERSPLMPPATYLDKITLSCEFQPGNDAWGMADSIRKILAAPPRQPPAAQPPAPGEAEDDALDCDRAADLAERLIAPGPKASHVSASECHELAEFVHAAIAALAQQRVPDAVRELPKWWRKRATRRRVDEVDGFTAAILDGCSNELESALSTIDQQQEARDGR